MSLFQNSVLNKYLTETDQLEIRSGYEKLVAYFHNPVIQQNIRDCKEEEYQSPFLIALFVNVFGYTLKPHPDFNLTREHKNEKGAKKADGAILKDGFAIGVIELKSTTTKDLESIRMQAFDYKSNQQKCVYVITSNFEKVRFYIHNAVEFEEFDLFRLNFDQFKIMWLCLAKENLLKGIPLAMKEDSVIKEQDITKNIYRDYSAFKKDLYNNLIENNLTLEIFKGKVEKEIKLHLFKKSQKLIDRFLFIFFGEDRGLLPPNSISEIIKQWENQSDWGDEVHLYDRYKKYFNLLNTGWKGKHYEIFAYNGGLFAPDEVLDNVKISDEVLKKHTRVLTSYDFKSEVDVNILGHIFENSLNEIEEVAAQIEGAEVNLKKSKRKKDGIFYTPKYITKYMVENTVGKLCKEKKAELGILDFDYDRDFKLKTWRIIESVTEVKVKNEVRQVIEKRKTNISVEGTNQLEILNNYRDWLLKLTICDPACGSGAFLNQALDFLITEHNTVTEFTQKITGDVSTMFIDIENQILEHNIYGVDINEESVEIAKLSLWLRTAQKGRKLTSLSNNIKCGNSLIDDPVVDGKNAFHWQTEFPEVFREKNKKAWHVTWVTHDTRTSARMIKYKVRERRANGEMYVDRSVYLTENDALKVTEIISEIVTEEKYNCLAFNIGFDHIHILLVCDEEELSNIVRKLKGKSAQKFKEYLQLDKEETFNLWAQKFNRKPIESEEQLQNTIEYITKNREKHFQNDIQQGVATPSQEIQESFNKGLQPLVQKMTCSSEYAFRTEYAGGFDVVIGNPPYVQLQSMGEMSDKLSKCEYESFNKGADLYCLFTERGFKLLKKGGLQSFIMPNKWMLVEYGKPLRKFLSKTGLRQILNFGDIQFFEEATTYVCIFVTQNSLPFESVEVLSLNKRNYLGDFITEVKNNIYNYSSSKFSDAEWSIQPYSDSLKLEKMKRNGIELKDLPIHINYGIKTGFNEAFYIDEATRNLLIAADPKSAELIKPMVRGRDISAYGITGFEYLIGTFPVLKLEIDNYPVIKSHLISFGYDRLKQTGESGARKKTNGKWFETQDSINYFEEFSKPKIIYPNMTSVFPFMYDEAGFFSNDKSFILTANDNSVSLLFLTAVLNSSQAKLWIWYNCPELQGGTREIRKVYFEHFPVPKANEEQTAQLASFATKRNGLNKELQLLVEKFQRTIQRRFNLDDLPLKIKEWHQLSFAEFTNELAKKKIKLSLSDEAEWEDYFNEQKQKAQTLNSEIAKTDHEIDQMVYELYGLKEEEIENIEEIKI